MTPLNLLAVTNKPVNDDILQFGVSPLHALIRFYECMLHVAYRLDFKTWRITGQNKKLLETQKKRIQEIRDAIGLRVDIPCSGGSGNTNDFRSA